MRFNESSFPWISSLIEDVSKVYDGTHQTPNYTQNGIKFVSVENITDLYSSKKFISVEDYERDFKVKPTINNILMTRIGDIGTPALVLENEPLAYYVSLALLKVHKIHPKFLYHYIQTPYFQKELWKRTLHVAFPKKINKNEIGECKIFYPKSIDEQDKIATFLSYLEKRIEVQNKIISDLKVLKKELMDYILNTCDFIELSIKDLIDCGFARIIKASEMKKFNGTRKYLSTSSIGENGIEEVESVITYTDRPSRASMLPIKGSIWFAKMKNSIKVYQSTDDDENHYILSTGFYGLLCDETKVNSRWIIELFKSDYFNTQKDKFSEGSSMSGIKDSQLADITLKVFSDKKQEIYHTNNIQNLSKKIQLEKDTLKILLKQKQFFLNAMFI